MTLSRDAQRRKDWRDRHQLDGPTPAGGSIPEQPTRLLCIVHGCSRPRARGQLCHPHDVETDP